MVILRIREAWHFSMSLKIFCFISGGKVYSFHHCYHYLPLLEMIMLCSSPVSPYFQLPPETRDFLGLDCFCFPLSAELSVLHKQRASVGPAWSTGPRWGSLFACLARASREPLSLTKRYMARIWALFSPCALFLLGSTETRRVYNLCTLSYWVAVGLSWDWVMFCLGSFFIVV